MKDNLENIHARDAFELFLRDLAAGRIEDMTLIEFEQQTGMKLTNQQGGLVSDLPDITQFLNRLLSLTVAMQEKVFNEFDTRLDSVIERASQDGTLDAGMETIMAKGAKRLRGEVVHTDRNGVQTIYNEIELTEDAYRLTFKEAERYGQEYVVNNTSGHVWVKGRTRSVTDTATGSVATKAFLVGPRTSHDVSISDLDDPKKYSKMDREGAKTLWEEEFNKLSATKTRKIHLITGALLPIWDRLPQEHVRVMRLKLDSGERLLGRLIAPKDLDKALKKLNVEKSSVKYTPEQVYDAIINNGETIILANDWRLKRVMSQGMVRVELIGDTAWRYETQLTNNGMLTERINYKTRLFVPTGEAGIRLIQHILGISPMFDAEGGGGQDPLKTSVGEDTIEYEVNEPQGVLFSTEAGPGDRRPRGSVPGNAKTEVVSREVDRYTAGTAKITGPDDVADIGRNLTDDPQEQFAAILIDDNGIVHSVHRFSRGTLNASLAHPTFVIGQALNTKGVTGMWLIHNHPSGVTELSEEDRRLGERFRNVAHASGVAVRGIMAVSPKEYSAIEYGEFADLDTEPKGKMPKRAATEALPVVERKYAKQGVLSRKEIHNPHEMKAEITKLNIGRPGQRTVILYNTRNQIISIMDIDSFLPLRGDRQRKLLEEIERRNAAVISVYAPDIELTVHEAKNIAHFGNAAGISVLDILDKRGSLKAAGMMEHTGNVFFSRPLDLANLSFDIRPPKGPLFSVEQVKQFLVGPLARWKNMGNVKVIKTAGELPARFMGYVQEGDTIFGAYDRVTDTTYIIADSISSARAAVVTLIHEAVGHRGVTAVLNDADTERIWKQIAKEYEGTPLMERILKGYGTKVGNAAIPLDLNNKHDRRIAVNEFVAHMAETRESTPLWTKIVGILRAALRRIAPDLKWTDADILHLIDRARTYSGVAPKAMTGGKYFKKDIETGNEVVNDILRQIEAMAPPSMDTPPKEIRPWLREHAKAAASTIMSYMPDSLPHGHFLERILKNPLWYEHSVLKELFNVMAHARQETYHELFNDFNDAGDGRTVADEIARFRKTEKKGYQDLSKILVLADTEWVRDREYSFEDRIREMKVSEDVKRFALLVRAAFDKMLDARQAPMKELLEEIEKQGYQEDPFALDEGTKNYHVYTVRPTKEFDSFWTLKGKEGQERAGLPYNKDINYVMGNNRAGGIGVQSIHFAKEFFEEGDVKAWWNDHKQFFHKAHKDYKAELRQTIMGALQVMDEWRGYYFPRLRQTGKMVVTAYKEDEYGDRQYIREHGSKYWSELRIKELAREGYKDIKAMDFQKLPESIYMDIKAIDVQKAIDYSLTGVKSKTSPDLLAKFNADLIEQASNMIRERGIESTKIHRMPKGRVVRGYIEDPVEAFLRYTSGVSGGMAKVEVSRKATELLSQIDPGSEAKVYDTAKRYIEENLRNVDAADRVMAYAKSIATLKFLGFNPRSAIVNLTAMVTSAPAAIHQYAGGKNISMAKVNREIALAGRDYAKHMAGKSIEGMDQLVVERITSEGYDTPQLTRDAVGAMQGGLERTWSQVMSVAMFLFGKTEQWNRGTTLLAAYRIAKLRFVEEGLRGEKLEEVAYKAAIEASDKAHAAYGKSNLPEWAQGIAVSARVGQAMYVYGNFGHNYVQLLYDLGVKKHNIIGFTWALAAPLVIAGGAAWPFKDELLWLINSMLSALGITTGVDKFVWDKTRKYLGDGSEILGRRGLFGLAGIDISGSLGIGLGIPTGLLGLTGAIGGVAEDLWKAGHFIASGQTDRALEKTLPTAAANIFRGVREAKTGVTTEKGRVLWDKGGKPFKPTKGETAARIVGFQSSRQSVARERSNEMYQAEQAFLKRKDDLYEELRAWAVDPKKTNAGLTKIYKKQGEYNKALTDAGLAGRVPLIRSSEMSRQIKGVMVPTRKDFLRLQR